MGGLSKQAARVALLGVAAMSAATVSAAEPVVLPPTGVNLEGLIQAAITALGAVAVVAVGGYFAFMVIKRGMRWAGRMG